MTALCSVPDVAEAVAAVLADPAVVGSSADGRTRPQSLAGGAAGIALLHIQRALTGRAPEATAHTWLRTAVSEPVSTGPNANLFHGAPALAFVLHTAYPLGRYRGPQIALDHITITITRQRLAAAHARIDRGDPLTMREFDLVHGLTGFGLYHLQAHPEHPVTGDLIGYLARITQPLTAATTRPPWWLPSGLGGTPDPQFPHGHGNVGAAHGISAVISLLATATLHGRSTPASREALDVLCDWTDQLRHDDPEGCWWPGYITADPAQTRRHRPSWCYGTAGTARAQQLAGLATHDTTRQQYAEHAMLAALGHRAQDDPLPGIGLCHGKAGLLQAAYRMAADSTDPDRAVRLNEAIPMLAADLATALHTTAETPEPELMNGTAGAALALHTASAGPPGTCWDAFLGLA